MLVADPHSTPFNIRNVSMYMHMEIVNDSRMCGTSAMHKFQNSFLTNSKKLGTNTKIYTECFQLMRYDDKCLNF